MTELPLWLQLVLAIVAGGGVVVGVYKAGQKDAVTKNGYVDQKECNRSMDKVDTSITALDKKVDISSEKLHSRITEVGKIAARIEGILQERG